MPLNEAGRAKFTGNTSHYIHLARHRQRIYLYRNIDAVVLHNEAVVRSKKLSARDTQTPDDSASSAGTVSPQPPRRRRRGIDAIAEHLSPTMSQAARDSQVLKIEAKSLKRVRVFTPRSSAAPTAETVPCITPLEPTLPSQRKIRCKCVIEIYEKIQPNKNRGETQPRRELVHMSGEFCTLSEISDDSASIDMDEPFFVPAPKLYVMFGGGQRGNPAASALKTKSQSYGLADSYDAEFILQPVEQLGPWPPLLHKDPLFCKLWEKDNLQVKMLARITSLPFSPVSALQEVYLRMSSCPDLRADVQMDIDCKWSRPLQHSNHALLGDRPPTPSSDRDPEPAPKATVLTVYYFMQAADDRYHRDRFGEANSRGEQCFSIPGFCCAFCDGKLFRNCNALHFHFQTHHELFSFRVKQRKVTAGIRSNNINYGSYVDVMVDLAKESSIVRTTEKQPDPKTFRWVKPSQEFDMAKIFKNEWGWLNDKKTRKETSRQQQQEEPYVPVERVVDLDNVPQVPPRIRRTYIVPEPILRKKKQSDPDLDPNTVFVRGKSKRFIVPGEELSESDEEADENWLQMKHVETIDDFDDISTPEKRMMQMWDKQMFLERPVGYCHIPHCVLRFAQRHAEVMREQDLIQEFFKLLLNLVQYECIEADCMKKALVIAKGGEENWSSVGFTTADIGSGPPSSSPLSSVSDRYATVDMKGKGKGKEKATVQEYHYQADAMDIDGDSNSPLTPVPESFRAATAASRSLPSNPPSPKRRDDGICEVSCTKGWIRPDMVVCKDDKCKRRWYHKSCQNVTERMPQNWRCESCMKSAETMAANASKMDISNLMHLD